MIASYDSSSVKRDLKSNVERSIYTTPVIIYLAKRHAMQQFPIRLILKSNIGHVSRCALDKRLFVVSQAARPEKESIHVSLTELCGSKLLQFLLPFGTIDLKLNVPLYLAENVYDLFSSRRIIQVSGKVKVSKIWKLKHPKVFVQNNSNSPLLISICILKYIMITYSQANVKVVKKPNKR